MKIFSEGETKLQFQLIHSRLISQKGVVVLKLQGYGFAGIETHTRGWTRPQLHVGENGLVVGSVYVLITEIGSIGAELF